MRIYNFILTYISSDIAAGAVTSLPIQDIGSTALKSGDVIRVYDPKSLTTLEFTLSADQTTGDTSLSVNSVTAPYKICYGAFVQIDKLDLLKQYQHKTRGTVAGFDIDADGITKGGVEITGWLDRDDFTGATANNVPTAESVKAYVDGETHANNFAALTCSGTSLTSATDGAANAVVVAYDTETTTSDTNTIIVYGATGVSGVSGGEYCFSVTPDEHPTKTAFEFSWSVGYDNSVANNRILVGAKLQQGVDSSGAMVWTDVDPTTSFAYNRGTGTIRYASTSNGMFVVIEGAQPLQYFRLVFWKEAASNASMKAITTLTGTNFRIKQIN